MRTVREAVLRRGWLCGLFASVFCMLLIGGCPGGDTTDPNTTDPNDANSTDPNDANDPNSGGIDDPNTTDPNDEPNLPDPNETDTPAPDALTWQLMVETGDDVPEQSAGTFTEFSTPVLDSAGRVAFWALYTGGDGDGGLYVWQDDAMEMVVDDNPNVVDVVPGQADSADAQFGLFTRSSSFNPLTQEFTWGGGDRLMFITRIRITSPSARTSLGIYRWRATDSNMVVVADASMMEDLYDDTQENAFDPGFELPGVSDAGKAVFGSDYLYISTGSEFISGTGIFTSNGTAVTPIADTRTSSLDPGDVPDQSSSTKYSSVNPRSTISPSGDIIYMAAYSGGTGSRGIFLSRGGTQYRVIDNRPNATWTGLASDITVGTGLTPYPNFAVGPSNHIAIDTTILQNSVTRQAVILWDWTRLSWSELRGDADEPVDTLVSGVSDDGELLALISGEPYIMSRTANTAIAATLPAELSGENLTWESTGSINDAGRAVIAYRYASGEPGLAYWNGSELLIVADMVLDIPEANIADITTITGPRMDRPGRSGFLNDDDQIVFRVEYEDGTEALWMATGNN